MNTLEVNVLGPLEMRMNGVSITPTAPKPRQVLALLALRAGQLVTNESIIDELWGRKVPRSALTTIQSYILRIRQGIRQVVPEVAREVVTTRPHGYRLDIPADDVDVHQFRELAKAGKHALLAGNCEAASELFGTALECWRGPALVDVEIGAQLGIELARLDQSRLTVLETRIEADLRLGRQHQLLDELAELTARYPMHETLCMQYMTALSDSGMKWRALEVFLTLRKNLVRELGIEPSLKVQLLQRFILSDGEKPNTHPGTLTKSG